MTPDATRRRAIGQILLLAAGFLVLVAISATSVILVNQAREDSRWVVHTVEVENQISTLLLRNPPRRKCRARLSSDLRTRDFLPNTKPRWRPSLPTLDKLIAADHRQSGSDRKRQTAARAGRGAAAGIRQGHRLRQAATTSPAASRCCAKAAADESVETMHEHRQCHAGRRRTAVRCSAPRPPIAPSGWPRS